VNKKWKGQWWYCNVIGSYPEPVEPTSHPYILSLTTILKLSSHLCLGLFSPGFQAKSKFYMYFLSLPCILHVCSISPSDHISNIWCRVWIMKLLIMYFSPSFCYFLPLRSTYSPQHFVFRYTLHSSLRAKDQVLCTKQQISLRRHEISLLVGNI
jgi:hypothetical protein